MSISTNGWVYRNLGANHHMWTQATLHDNRWLTGYTRTASFTMFGGFTGGMFITCVDANGMIVARTPDTWRWGVDGTWVGRSDRTEPWWNLMPQQDILQRTASLA